MGWLSVVESNGQVVLRTAPSGLLVGQAADMSSGEEGLEDEDEGGDVMATFAKMQEVWDSLCVCSGGADGCKGAPRHGWLDPRFELWQGLLRNHDVSQLAL